MPTMAQYTSGNPVMMILGTYKFQLTAAAYQTLTRTTSYQWPENKRFGQRPALQYTGLGDDTIRLPGVIYPEWRGGTGQINAMRAQAGTGKPLRMIDGQGNVMGRWVIERVEERQSVMAAAGVPRKQEFTLQLKRYD